MNQQSIIIELLEDTVISATSATAGAHHSLDYIPGATLLGAAAARLYGQLGSEAFGVFHGNAARFSDGLPLVADRPAWPVPLSWHEEKFNPARADSKVDGAQLINLATDQRPEGSQLKQLREAHVDIATGAWIKLALRLRMKTALQEGSAKEGALFGYEAIPAGSRFLATISARDEALLEQLMDVFQQGILIGRSRSAEYGRASVTLENPPALPETVDSPSSDLNFLYLASDLCLLNRNGQPCLAPEGEDLGIEGAKLVPENSFLRTRSYAPWNAYRRHHDMERQVIARGSVLALDGDIDPAALQAIARDGLGLYRNQGLGRVLVNPSFVVNPQDVVGNEDVKETAPEKPERPSTPLIELLDERAGSSTVKAGIAQQAEKFSKEIRKVLKEARLAGGILDSEDFGPSASQWSKFCDLRNMKCKGKNELMLAIFGPEEKPDEKKPDKKPRSDEIGIARPDHQNWKEKIWVGSEQLTIADWFRRELEKEARTDLIDKARNPTRALRELVIETAILMSKKEEARR